MSFAGYVKGLRAQAWITSTGTGKTTKWITFGESAPPAKEAEQEGNTRRNKMRRGEVIDPEVRAERNRRKNLAARERYRTDKEWRARHKAAQAKCRATPHGKAQRSEEGKRWYARNKGVQRARMRLNRYGVDAPMWQAQIEAQCYKCANSVCNNPINDSSPLDHCHTTGRVRGILCPHCNMIEGVLDKHMDRLLGLMEYRDMGGVWIEADLLTENS